MEKITLGGGCFWCMEAIFQNIKGIKEILPGYSGGKINNPSYEQVCTGKTGHAEVVQISFNPNEITLQCILDIFFASHDPTTLNRQGNDIGTQYRSVIFYHNENQKKIAKQIIDKLEKNNVFANKIVTEVLPLKNFFPAEDYHKKYFIKNKEKPYCKMVINPKINKVRKKFFKLWTTK